MQLTEGVTRGLFERRRGVGGYPHGLHLLHGRVTTDAEPGEGFGDCKDAVRARVEANVVVVRAAAAAADRYLICELDQGRGS
jgi:hypothetical protein